MCRRLAGCYGSDARALIDAAKPEELKEIPTTCTLWAELRWAARDEGIVHLEDLMLRRTRLGLTFPEGGKALLPAIQINLSDRTRMGQCPLGGRRTIIFVIMADDAIICRRK